MTTTSPELVGAAPDAARHEPQLWDRRRDRRAAALLFLCVWAVYLATATYTIAQTNDTRSAAMAAWSVGHRGQLALPDWDVEPRNYWGTEGADGRTYSNRFPGVIMWGVPFYAAQRALFGADEPEHPWLVDFRPAGVAAATAAALAVAAAFVLARRLVDRRLAVVFAVLLGFATPFWSVAADSLWPHAILSLMLLVTMLSLSSPRPAGPALAGSVAFAITARPHIAVAHGVIGLWTLARRRWRTSVVLAVGGAAGIGATALYTRLVFGTWMPSAGYNAGSRVERAMSGSWTDTFEGIAAAAASGQRGIFVWAPFLLLLVPFLRRGWRASPEWARVSAVAGVLYLLVQLRQNVWHGGFGYFGFRLQIEMVVLAAPLLLVTWREAIAPEWLLRKAFAVVVAATIVLYAVGATYLSVPRSTKDNWDRIVSRVEAEVGASDDRAAP